MAYTLGCVIDGTRQALANYSSGTDAFILVRSTANTTFSRATSATVFILGVLQEQTASGVPGPIAISGITKVRVDSTSHAAIAVGDKLICSTAGAALPGATTVTQYVWGRALETLSSNSTGVITAIITHEGAGSTNAVTG